MWPGTTLAVPGLGPVLAGGRFVVTGFAVFHPAAPFQPAPTIPSRFPEPGELVAWERVGGHAGGVTFPR